MATTRPTPMFDAAKMVGDMTAKGWEITRLAAESHLSHMTVRRFLDGSVQTTKTATRIAGALGYSIRRYLAGVREAA